MESIRKFIDFCGPAVYVVMFMLCGYLIWKSGWGVIDLNLGGVKYTGNTLVRSCSARSRWWCPTSPARC